MTEADIPARVAKQHATYDSIEEAATQLVLDRDFDSVTVEEICQQAGVSRRTFFNYFDSKETAVFGLPVAPPLPEARHAFVEPEHPDLVGALVRFCAEHVIFGQRVDGRTPPACVVKRRKVLNRRSPHSVARRAYRTPELISSLEDMIRTYFSAHPGSEREFPGIEGADLSRGLLALTLSALHLGVFNWVESDSTDLNELLPRCDRALNSICALTSYRSDPEEGSTDLIPRRLSR